MPDNNSGPSNSTTVEPLTTNSSEIRPKLSKMLQLHGYLACRESLLLLEDHYINSNLYESLEDFVVKFNNCITFETETDNSLINPNLANFAIQKLRGDPVEISQPNLTIKINNVEFYQQGSGDFNIHYNYLFRRLQTMPVFSGDFQLTRLETLTASTKPSIRCICFGLLVKDISKIDGYMLIDSTGRVPIRIRPETTFRNRLAYLNCIVLVEGVYINPDDLLYAANIGLPPVMLEPVQNKSLTEDKMVVLIKEPFLDDEEVNKALDMLFTGYNSMEEPPLIFILVGDFTRTPCDLETQTKKVFRILKSCDNLKSSHFVLVPSQHNTTPELISCNNFNLHITTNPVHINVGERIISVVSHSYIKELHKNLLHDLSDTRDELFDTIQQVVLSNAHLSAGISKTYNSYMRLWHRPDLLVLADSGAFGNRYDYSSSNQDNTSFATLPSFARQSFQFKVYYLKTGEIEESQVSSDAIEYIID